MAGHRIHATVERILSGVVGGRFDGRGRTQDRPRDEERPAELLVGRHGDRGEPRGLRSLGRSDEQPRLADPRLPFDREPDEPAGAGCGQFLRDRLELRRPPDDVAGCPVDVERHRGERKWSVVVRDHSVSAGRPKVGK